MERSFADRCPLCSWYSSGGSACTGLDGHMAPACLGRLVRSRSPVRHRCRRQPPSCAMLAQIGCFAAPGGQYPSALCNHDVGFRLGCVLARDAGRSGAGRAAARAELGDHAGRPQRILVAQCHRRSWPGDNRTDGIRLWRRPLKACETGPRDLHKLMTHLVVEHDVRGPGKPCRRYRPRGCAPGAPGRRFERGAPARPVAGHQGGASRYGEPCLRFPLTARDGRMVSGAGAKPYTW